MVSFDVRSIIRRVLDCIICEKIIFIVKKIMRTFTFHNTKYKASCKTTDTCIFSIFTVYLVPK